MYNQALILSSVFFCICFGVYEIFCLLCCFPDNSFLFGCCY